MHTINFAKIRNAKALLLTPDKRVLHFPATNKVRIDNILPDELYYRSAAQRSNRKEYANANTAALETGLVPPVQNYRERGNMTSYTQDYAGRRLPNKLEGIKPKEQYKLGSQVGRIQNRLREQDLGHTDIHEGNIVRPNPKRREVKLIDNASIENIKDKYDEAEVKNLYAAKRLGKPFMTGYNSRINFTQHKQMQHFTHFADTHSSSANFSLTNLGAVGAVQGARTGLGAGALYGLARGMGAGETQEEKDSTTALGRVGKILGRTTTGAVAGAGIGTIAGGAAAVGYGQLRRKNQGFDKWADKVGLTSEKNWDDRIAAVRAKRTVPDPQANAARQAGQAPNTYSLD
jgi:tRNA A-37 threonylcarbamoyl transferase component Bud32